MWRHDGIRMEFNKRKKKYLNSTKIDVASWGSGITIEDGMFYAYSGTVKNTVVARKTLSSAALGGEGLFNLSLLGNGIAV